MEQEITKQPRRRTGSSHDKFAKKYLRSTVIVAANLNSIFRHIHEADIDPVVPLGFRTNRGVVLCPERSFDDRLFQTGYFERIRRKRGCIEMIETIPGGILQEGFALGMDKGKIQEKIEIARNMKHEGCDPAFISKITGLSSDEIAKLK